MGRIIGVIIIQLFTGSSTVLRLMLRMRRGYLSLCLHYYYYIIHVNNHATVDQRPRVSEGAGTTHAFAFLVGAGRSARDIRHVKQLL